VISEAQCDSLGIVKAIVVVVVVVVVVAPKIFHSQYNIKFLLYPD